MRDYGKSSLGISGSLLIAHPNLLDPNFKRTVLFIPVNDPQDGSFGLILNRPTGKSVIDFLPDQDVGDLAGLPVFVGGPVGANQLTFASFRWDPAREAIECQTHVGIDEAWKLTGDENCSLRAFVGYAGWSKGQLESELSQKAWLVQKPDRDLLDAEKCSGLWQTIMRDQGPWFKLLAAAPDDPTLN